MKKTKEEAAQTRKAVLEAAVKTFSTKGFSGTNLADVAKEAGMTRGAIYWHFKNKYELLEAVIRQTHERMKVRVDKVFASSLSPLNKARQLLHEFFLIVSEEDELSVIEELVVFKSETRKELQRFYKAHMEKVREMRELMTGLIREGIEIGEIDSRLDPETAALAWISYIGGVKLVWSSGIAPFSIRKSAESLADIFINGIARKK